VEWFNLVDASQTGVGFAKYNGENPNAGLFNVADRPYKPMLEEMVKTNYEIYQVAAGERPRYRFDHPRFSTGTGRKNSVTASRVAAPLTIDGQSGDWPGMPAEPVGSDRLVEGKAAGNFSASFRLGWDDQHLYVLADVNDETPMKNTRSGADLWAGDGIELFLGSEGLEKAGQLLFTDRQILISANQEGDGKVYFVNAPEQYSCRVAVVPKGGNAGYVLEAAIPWTALAVARPEPNREFAFDLAADDSLDGTRRDKQLMWNGTNKNSSDRSHWGRFRLIGQ
jgi:hypothetical protein